MPKVSVVIPSYNCAAYLAKAIDSVLAQTFQDLEIVVVDDGSTDTTPEIIRPYLEQVRYIRQINTGLPGARNTAIRAAQGEFIALLDADDSWLPEKLALQMPLFADAEVGIVYSDFAVTYADGRFLSSYLADRPLTAEGYVAEPYIRSRFLFPSTMVLRRTALEQCGLFDEDMLAAEDIALFTRICLRWKVALVRQPLMIRTEGTHNITSSGERMAVYSLKAFHRVLEREPHMTLGVRRVLFEELGRQHSWRAYTLMKRGERRQALTHMAQAVRFDWRTAPANLRACLASFLPASLVTRLRRPRPASA